MGKHESGKELVGALLDPPEAERLRKIAKRRMWTKSQAARVLIESGLKHDGRRLEAEA